MKIRSRMKIRSKCQPDTSQNMDDYDEPYHFSPACDPDDIILEGSDAEETPEETLAKRARYEAQAERYRNGAVPFIMTASMKGPFDRASGWENPWRYQPRNSPEPVQEDDWWKPGSEDMMFTRKNVLKRAADHGLGWMTPAAALEWCKAAASAEVEAGGESTRSMQTDVGSNGRHSRGSVSTGTHISTEANAQPRQAIYTQGQPSTTGSEQPHRALCTQGQLSTAESEQPCQIDISTESGFSTNRDEDSFTRGTKRPHGLEWLKGSYSSKRGRWDDGPPLPSPTPLPVMCRRDAASKPMLSTPVAATSQQSSPLEQHTSKTKTKDRKHSGNKKRLKKSALESSTQGKIKDRLLSTKSRHVSTQNAHHKASEFEEDSITAMSFCYGSTLKLDASEKAPNPVKVVSSEPNESVEHEPLGPRTEIPPFPTVSKTDALNTSPESPDLLVEESDPLNEISFITEVVPSCRDLEKFQFRKKKKLFQQNADSSGLCSSGAKKKTASPQERRDSVRSSIKFSSPVANLDDHDEEWETTIGIGRTGEIDSYSQSRSNLPKSSSRKSRGSIRPTSPNPFMGFEEDDGDEEWETTNGDREDPISSGSASELDDDDYNEDWETTIGERQPDVTQRDPLLTSSNKAVYMENASPKDMLPTLEETITPPKSQYSSSSWDMVDDITASSFRRVVVTSPDEPQPPKDHPSENHETPTTPLPIPISERASVAKTTAPRVVSLPRSSRQASSLASKPPRKTSSMMASPTKPNIKSSPLAPVTPKMIKADKTIDQNDISTQSANTSPARSHKKPKSPSSRSSRSSRRRVAQRRGSFISEGNSTIGSNIGENELLDATIEPDRQPSQIEAKTGKHEEDEMSQIQLTLSQICPSSSSHASESSWGHDSQARPDQEADVTITEQSARSQVDDAPPMSPSGATQPKPLRMGSAEKSMSSNTSPRSVGTTTPATSKFAMVHDVNSSTPVVLRENSQASGPQTPWADNDVWPTIASVAALKSTEAEAIIVRKEDIEPDETDWEQFERSLLAQKERITPLEAFITPLRSPEAAKVGLNRSSNAEDDTAINPWTSSLRKTGSKKTKKRVSFGFDLAEEESEIFRPPTPIIERSQVSQSEPDPLDDGHPPPRPISMIGSSEATQRTFKRMLPDKTASQINSSPAPIEAMAEAFIDADQEAPLKRRPSTPLQSRTQSSRLYRRPSWGDEQNGNTGFPGFSPLNETTPVRDFMKDFDIADALGDANAFLEDWSVEADLKKSREAEMREHESNGMKRRKLFGLV